MVERQLLPPYVSSHGFYRLSKYLFPCNRLALNLGSAPAPRKLAALDDFLLLYPSLVEQIHLGHDRDWGQVTFETLHNGEFHDMTASAEPVCNLRVFRFHQATTVGRHSSILGPENTLVADLGYFVPQADPGSARWTDMWDVRFWRSRWLVDLRFRRQLPAVTKVPGVVAILNNPWCHNYYHWLLEVAPRAMMVRQTGVHVDWYVVDCQSGFQRQALELMGVPLDRCIQPHYGLHLQADQLLRPSFPGLQQCRMMADAIKSNVGPGPQETEGGRVYISRKRATHRKVANEVELVQRLEQHGFKTYSFDGLSYAEQVRIVRSAEAIVTVHGAALANLIFAKPGIRVIEICPIDRYNPDCFPRLSHKLGHHHLSVMVPRTRFRQNLTVNLDDIDLALEHQGLRQTEGRSSQRSKAA